MSSFKHNPYQQFSPSQPSQPSQPSSASRCVVVTQQKQPPEQAEQPEQETPQRPPVAPPSVPHPSLLLTSPCSPPSTGAPAFPPSVSGGAALSRHVVGDDSDSRDARAEVDVPPPFSGGARNPHYANLVPQSPPPPQHQQPQLCQAPAPQLSTLPTFPSVLQPPSPQARSPWQTSETFSSTSYNPSTSFSAVAASTIEPARKAMPEGGQGSYGGAGGATAAAASTDTLARTLFIDGLPPTIENQHQLNPFVPPQGRVAVRVKRSRGRDVGFAVYDNVDAASAALEWFHEIRMTTEKVQASGYVGVPGSFLAYAAAAQRPEFWPAPAAAAGPLLPQQALAGRGGSDDAVQSNATLLPISYEDYLRTRHDPVQYDQLLRQSVSLRVEWAHTHEIRRPHHPYSSSSQQQQYPSSSSSVSPLRAAVGLLPASPVVPPFHDQSGFSVRDSESFAQFYSLPFQSAVHVAAPPPAATHHPTTPQEAVHRLHTEEFDFAVPPPSLSAFPAHGPPSMERPPQPSYPMAHPPQPQQYHHHQQQLPTQREPVGVAGTCEESGLEAEHDYTPYFTPTLSHAHAGLRLTSPTITSPTTTTTTTATQSPNRSLTSTTSPMLPPQLPRGRVDRRLPSRTLFVRLVHNFPLPPSLARAPPSATDVRHDPASPSSPTRVPDGAVSSGGPSPPVSVSVHGVESAVMTVEDRALFGLAQRVCREEFFSEQFAGFVRYHPFLHPPYYGGCFVLFERDTDMQRCLQWMRRDARLMTLFSVQPARNDTFEH